MGLLHSKLKLTSLLGALAFILAPPLALAKPPQFVLMAFDGSQSLPFWQKTRAFARSATQAGSPVKFTYFVSGVYFLNAKNKLLYQSPNAAPGESAIGFGTTPLEVSARVDQINAAFTEGHEIGTHLNGHFDGSHWTASDWLSDFHQFFQFFADVFHNNGLVNQHWEFAQKDIVGFRAPLLGVSPALWPTLPETGIAYDTSKVSASNYWPQKNKYGTWNFPLAHLKIAGTNLNTLSMDYNFYQAQSHASEQPEHRALFEKQMLETYLQYFRSNYYGNRAPVNIGHHFMSFNGGAYWAALQSFALKVCGLPDVKCVTYHELMDYMNALPKEKREAYQNANSTERMEETPDGLTAFVPKLSDGESLQADSSCAQD